MAGEKAKLLCSFGGEFISQQGKPFYVGGKTRLVSIDRSASFRSLLSKMSELCDADPSSLDIKFQLPDGGLESRLVSVETDDDVRNMMEEFDSNRKISIFLFTDKTQNTDDDDIAVQDDVPTLEAVATEAVRNYRELTTAAAEEPLESQSDRSTSATSARRDYGRHSLVGPSMSGERFRRESQSLVVGQEYEDVQTFRNALTSAAIAANFELHMIRSDQRRVTARCAAEGCMWRVHASKLPQVSTFRIRTLTPEHTCVRSEDAGHRQATAKWIANCIRDKLRQNRNYKPREILNDIHREYGVLITYKRAFLGREKALEELRAEPARNMAPIESSYEAIMENHSEVQTWGQIHDPPRKKRAYRPHQPKEVRPLHCTRCNQIGHNRRTCTVAESMQDGIR
ncbi:uncharacterized protein LOC103704473 isoform X1 [Phoenix dactylifera]|uniref:Uncharacterized protein LOC103704473 isoform X1 n=1 Tax=Phoenix dactylifera TaxID=42345 RepID=A0A8B7BV04_PHODC|nr:uncharacterized protein LOC103704473 isoform X1 [Phoenix dactylifera]